MIKTHHKIHRLKIRADERKTDVTHIKAAEENHK